MQYTGAGPEPLGPRGSSVQGDGSRRTVLLFVALAAVLFAGWWTWQRVAGPARAQGKVAVKEARLSLARDDGGDLSFVDRTRTTEIFFRVTLEPAPVGERLSLGCDWVGPEGHLARQNRYDTKSIDQTSWLTWCRHTIGPSSPTGTWKVTMSQDGRELARRTFEVREGTSDRGQK